MKDLPKRKLNRLQGHDYCKAGKYFVTICVKEKHEILWNANTDCDCVFKDKKHLSEYGAIIDNEINNIEKKYNKLVVVNKYCIMPNHIHIIIVLENDDEGIKSQNVPTISRVIKQFKGSISKQIGFSMWQKSYHDHIIRNKSEYQQICRYIDANPLMWEKDCFRNNENQ